MQPETIEGEIIQDADKLNFISIARWKECLKNRDYKDLKHLAEKLPLLKDSLLNLDRSKDRYEEMISGFLDFIREDKDSAFGEIKEMILDMGLA